MRTFLVLLVIAALGAGGWYFWKVRSAKASTTPADLVSAKVTRGAVVQSVAATGRVVSNLDVDIKCKASGEVITLPYDVSDSVEKDQVVVQIDPIDEQRSVAIATVTLARSQAKLEQSKIALNVARQSLDNSKERVKANLDLANAKVKDAEAKAKRRRELLTRNLGTQEEYDTAETAAAAARAEVATLVVQQKELETQKVELDIKDRDVTLADEQVKSDKIALEMANKRLTDTTVKAPISGVVSSRAVQKGQIISSGITNVGGGTAVLTLSDLSRIFVLASVDESDIGRVRLDQPVDITVDAHPGMKFSGNVVRIATKGVNVSNVVTFEVKIEVTGENKKLLKPEMTANVQIIQQRKENVLLVPVQAVIRKEGDKRFVTVQKEAGGSEQRPVEVGISDASQMEIASGLEEDETVLYRKNEQESSWRRGGPPMMFGGRSGGGGGRK